MAIRSLLPAVVTAAMLLIAIVSVDRVIPSSDFPPFVMRIEPSEGAPAELRYTDRSNWSMHAAGDDYTYACRDGVYGHYDAAGAFHHGRIADAVPCPAPARWIGYGWASSIPWTKTLQGDTITYTSSGERVVFDRTTGLPLLYEAGPSGSSPIYRVVFAIVR